MTDRYSPAYMSPLREAHEEPHAEGNGDPPPAPDHGKRTPSSSPVRIAVPIPVKETFFYAVPEHFERSIRIGSPVRVPLKNRIVTGYVLEKIPPQQNQPLKEILEVLDSDPLFHQTMVPFFQWMADYYLHPIGQLIQSCLPGGLNKDPFKTGILTEKGQDILNTLPLRSEERQILSWVGEHPGKRPPWPLKALYPLQKRGWVKLQERARRGGTGPLMRKFVRPKGHLDLQTVLADRATTGRAKNETAFLQFLFNSGSILLSELTSRFNNGSYLAKKWIKHGVLEAYEAPVIRDPAGTIRFPVPEPVTLHEQQERALQALREALDQSGFAPFLLYGVTGSGKTEVYYRALQHAFSLGRQAILIVPEISLAGYMEGLFRSRLKERIAIYHSGLSPGERFDQWRQMVGGQFDLVIGARSALFAPLPRLGLIIVDEEHDSAYKQENRPHYQARDMAVVRGKMEKAVVILGSGTPSVQSFQNSLTGRYSLLTMPERVESRPLPDVEIVDMKAEEEKPSRDGVLSHKLKSALDQNLKAGNQSMLFLNRRGFHRLYLCRSCGQSVHCPNCDVVLTHHLREDCLSCHYCGYHSNPPAACPSCGQGQLKAFGFGTEKLEHELMTLFPQARVARMDADSVRRKGQALRILKRFSRQEIDMLVGTQMITKGYDFPGVTLVGVVAADLSLAFPDFRAGERTFQLLSQVAGRSGRGSQRGRVIIQTFNPDHYAIRAAMAHDYHCFFEKERKLREQLGYPPFSHLVCLRLQGNSQERTEASVKRLSLEIEGILRRWPKRGKEIQVLGPAESPLSKLKGKFRWQILIKCKNAWLLHRLLTEVERLSADVLKSAGVQLVMDVDPYQML